MLVYCHQKNSDGCKTEIKRNRGDRRVNWRKRGDEERRLEEERRQEERKLEQERRQEERRLEQERMQIKEKKQTRQGREEAGGE